MVKTFYKIAGWICCGCILVLFVLGFAFSLRSPQVIWPSKWLHPGYSYEQWNALLAAHASPKGMALFIENCTMLLGNFLSVIMAGILALRLCWREVPAKYAAAICLAGAALGGVLVWNNYHAEWYLSYMLLSFPLAEALAWIAYTLATFAFGRSAAE